MNKTIRKLMAWLAVLFLLLSVTACGASLEEEIVGEWHLTEESESVDQSAFYPEVSVLIFSEDGTWNGELNNTYSVSGNTITMDSADLVHPYTYDVDVDGDILMLQYQGAAPIYYQREGRAGSNETESAEDPYIGTYTGQLGSSLQLFQDGTCRFYYWRDGSTGTGHWSVCTILDSAPSLDETRLCIEVSNLDHEIYADVTRSTEVFWMEKDGSYRWGDWEDEVFTKE